MGCFTPFPLLFLYFFLRPLNRTPEPSPSSCRGSGESQLSWSPAAPVGGRPGGPLGGFIPACSAHEGSAGFPWRVEMNGK